MVSSKLIRIFNLLCFVVDRCRDTFRCFDVSQQNDSFEELFNYLQEDIQRAVNQQLDSLK